MNKTNKKWTSESFKQFLKKPIPKETEEYQFAAKMILVDVFAIDPPEKPKLLGLEGMAKEDFGFRWTSIGRVVSSSSELYKEGDIVKFWDQKVAIFENPKYGEWESFAPKGNVTKIGEPPPKYVTNFYNSFMKYVFLLSPILNNKDDMKLFLLPEHEVVAKIKNPLVLAEIIEDHEIIPTGVPQKNEDGNYHV
ncbi:MAG TPA: hypothetical protein PLP63_06820 [Saprospiraceae bacterium]|nr:hypothetical protein [Saprospiraceae bacterium]